MSVRKSWQETRKYWPVMGFYERFEQIVALTLTAVISLIIFVALCRLVVTVFTQLVFGIQNPLEHATFQHVFGMIMTLLIAMEFKHSILPILERKAAIVRVRTVLLIALLAVARKFIIMDFQAVSPATLAALGFSMVAIGMVYWFLRMQDEEAGFTLGRRSARSDK